MRSAAETRNCVVTLSQKVFYHIEPKPFDFVRNRRVLCCFCSLFNMGQIWTNLLWPQLLNNHLSWKRGLCSGAQSRRCEDINGAHRDIFSAFRWSWNPVFYFPGHNLSKDTYLSRRSGVGGGFLLLDWKWAGCVSPDSGQSAVDRCQSGLWCGFAQGQTGDFGLNCLVFYHVYRNYARQSP